MTVQATIELITDISVVLLLETVALLITISNVADWLKVVSIILAIGYTSWKWVTDYKKSKKKKK